MSAIQRDVIDISDESSLSTIELPEAPRPARKIVGAAVTALALVVAGFFVYEFVLSGYMEARSQRILMTQFEALTNQGPASTLEWVPAMGQPVALMTIPKLGVKQIVVEGTSSALTAQGPGHYRGSPLPGRPGNSVIMGRRTTYGSPFGLLDLLRPGDAIQVATGVGSWIYTVHSVAELEPGASDVLGPTTDNRLTLVTSSPPYRATGRLVVVAYLSGSPASQPLQAPPMLTTSEYGLTGEPAALGGLIIWIEILAVALFFSTRLARGLPRRVMWLLYAPIFIALAFAVSGTLSRLLPATF